MFGMGYSAAADWKDANAMMVEIIAGLLEKMSAESQTMQACIGSAVDSETDAVAALMKLQKLDFQTQKQTDLAAVLRVLADNVRQGAFDPDVVESAANLHELRDAIARRPRRVSRRRFSIGRLDWFD